MNARIADTARYDINHFTIREMTECGKALRMIGEGAKSMEEVADRIVRYLYDNLIDGETGMRACALVRLFKTHAYEGLDAELQEFAQNMLGNKPAHPGNEMHGPSGNDRGGAAMAIKEDLQGTQGSSSPQ